MRRFRNSRALLMFTLSGLLLVATVRPPEAASQASSAPAPRLAEQPLTSSIASTPEWPAAQAADVDTVDHLLAALYDVISGSETKQRDWKRFRSLFLPTGRLGVVRPALPATATAPARSGDVVFLTPEQYVERDDAYFKSNGFFEHSIANRVETFGDLTAVWSTYESRHAAADAQPFARGINALQIVRAQGRYWIASILWDEERAGLTLPSKYLATPGASDDPDAHPAVSALDLRIVRRAAEILKSPAKWNRADNRQCPPAATTYSLYCALEVATEEVGGQFEHREAAMQEARFVIDALAPNRKYEHRLMNYNNDPTTSFADIQNVFRLLEQRIQHELERGAGRTGS